MSLDQYHAKRRFDQTPEPQGGQGSGPLRFVVQKHAASRLHYDFRLEAGGVLKSWAVPKGPSLNPHDKHLAIMTEDHPYDYRTFEGVIPEGNYGAGTVMIWDEGTYEPVIWDQKTGATKHPDHKEQDRAARRMVHEGHVTFILHGAKLKGEFALIKMHDSDEENAWLLIKADKDDAVSTRDVTRHDRSATTGRTMTQIARGQTATWTHAPGLDDAPQAPLPETISPMLATLTDKPFNDEDWLYEVKWDGYRAIATITPDAVQLRSRRDQDFETKYPSVVAGLQNIKGATAVLDGEIVVLDEHGRSNFGQLQTYAETGGSLVYYVFDLLYLDGHDLTGLPLLRRKQILQDWLPTSSTICYSDHVAGQGQAFFKAASQQGLEGIMAKDGRSRYLPGKRAQSWLKIKTHARQEAVIGGYTAPRGSRAGFGALVLGVYEDDGRLHYIGHAGGGFTDRLITDVLARLEPLRRATSPFAESFQTNAPVTWVKPSLVAEVEFHEWTADGIMRQPIFIGLRPDKPAQAVRRETPATPAPVADTVPAPRPQKSPSARGLNLTHLDKVFFPGPGYTKGDLIAYYRAVAPYILPYIKDRPLSLLRQPDGVTDKGFFQKDQENLPGWVPSTDIYSESTHANLHWMVGGSLDALLYAVQLGTIEINPWNSRVGRLDQPDWAVIDLDPEGVTFKDVVTIAHATKQVCDDWEVPCYPKTSGKTGLHIYIPLHAKYTYDQARTFAHLLATEVNKREPKLTSIERVPSKRPHRIYLDFLQNSRGQTLAAPYSARPTADATVSTPLNWDEVTPKLRPTQFTIKNLPERLKETGDLWKPVIGPGVDLRRLLERLG